MGRRRGPSPLVPSLMVVVLSLVVFWPYILWLVSYLIVTLFQEEEEEEAGGVASSFMILLLPLSLLLLIQLLSARSPSSRFRISPQGKIWQNRRSDYYDGEGFGFGTLILVVLYFLLYNYM